MFMVSKLYMYIDQYNFFSKAMFNKKYDEQLKSVLCCSLSSFPIIVSSALALHQWNPYYHYFFSTCRHTITML